MDMAQMAAIGLTGTLLAVTLRRENAQMALLVSVTTGVLLFLSLLSPLGELLGILQETAQKAGVSDGYFAIVLKVIGIAYLAQFGAQLCMDAGETAIAAKIELAGKILIMAVSAPVLIELLDVVLHLV